MHDALWKQESRTYCPSTRSMNMIWEELLCDVYLIDGVYTQFFFYGFVFSETLLRDCEKEC